MDSNVIFKKEVEKLYFEDRNIIHKMSIYNILYYFKIPEEIVKDHINVVLNNNGGNNSVHSNYPAMSFNPEFINSTILPYLLQNYKNSELELRLLNIIKYNPLTKDSISIITDLIKNNKLKNESYIDYIINYLLKYNQLDKNFIKNNFNFKNREIDINYYCLKYQESFNNDISDFINSDLFINKFPSAAKYSVLFHIYCRKPWKINREVIINILEKLRKLDYYRFNQSQQRKINSKIIDYLNPSWWEDDNSVLLNYYLSNYKNNINNIDWVKSYKNGFIGYIITKHDQNKSKTRSFEIFHLTKKDNYITAPKGLYLDFFNKEDLKYNNLPPLNIYRIYVDISWVNWNRFRFGEVIFDKCYILKNITYNNYYK